MFNRELQAAKAAARRVKALAGREKSAPPSAEVLLSRKTPVYMLRDFGVRSYDRALRNSKGEIFRKGLHVTAKTHRGIPCRVTPGENPDARIERLQMLKDRRLRREERRAHG